MTTGECVFCKIIARKIPSKIEFENDEIMAFGDILPQAPVHLLVIPKRHIAKTPDLKDDDVLLVGRVLLAASDLARQKGLDEHGYRIVINSGADAGQEVPHLHVHLLGGRKFSWPPG